MKNSFFNALLVFLSSCLLASCSTKIPDPTIAFRGQSAEQIYRSAEQDLADSSYLESIKTFEALDILYPFAKVTEQARLDMIFAYYKADQPEAAVAEADRFIRLYPTHSHVDYAYYMKGLTTFYQGRDFFQHYFPGDLAMRDLSRAKQAFSAFNALVVEYPTSFYAKDAELRMAYLRNLFARHDLLIAQYYLQREAYVAALNRANEVVAFYQHAPAVVDALVVQVKAYRALQMPDEATRALSVLKRSYPSFRQLREVDL